MYDIPGSDCHEWSSVKERRTPEGLRGVGDGEAAGLHGCMAAWAGRRECRVGWKGWVMILTIGPEQDQEYTKLMTEGLTGMPPVDGSEALSLAPTSDSNVWGTP